MTTISVSQLGKSFGRVRAVDDLSFAVPAGRVTGFLGPNGAGKTTTLRMLLGLVRPDTGTALLGGRRYADLTAPVRTVGAVLEATAFHPGRTARTVLVSSHGLAELARTADEVVIIRDGRLVAEAVVDADLEDTYRGLVRGAS